MSSEFGEYIKMTVFGQSHGKAVGVVLDGLPVGEPIDTDALLRFSARRAPGRDRFSSPRREADIPTILSGLENGKTCGAPLCAVIENTDVQSADYATFADTPRPSHADYTAFVKYGGAADMRGGGHFSGRLTAPMCVAGGICMQILARRGITVGAHILRLHGVEDTPFSPTLLTAEALTAPGNAPFPVCNTAVAAAMQAEIDSARANGDSVGGVIECGAIGLPAGYGAPLFGGVENRLAAAMFAIPALRGIAFGAGFDAADMTGSAHNDPFCFDGTDVKTKTNHHGGVLGGITSGMPLLFTVAIKPTPSIAMAQETVNLRTGENTKITVNGRHDPCIAARAVPCVEALTAFTLLDILSEGK